MRCGFTEAVYQECLEIELDLEKVPFVARPTVRIAYKRHVLTKTFEPDFILFDKVVLELKAVSKLTDEHRAQVLNYLNATGHEVALLVNFGCYPKLQYERIVHQQKNPISD
jgi:GxxExxY protein